MIKRYGGDITSLLRHRIAKADGGELSDDSYDVPVPKVDASNPEAAAYLQSLPKPETGFWATARDAAKRFTNYDRQFTDDVLNLPRRIYENPTALRKGMQNILGGGTDPGEERAQLWPERMIRSGFTLPHGVATGEVPMNVTDPNTGEVHTNPEVIERTQDLAGMAGGQTLLTGRSRAGNLPKGATDVTATPAAEAGLDVRGGLAGAPGGGEGLRTAELQAQRWAGERTALPGLPRNPVQVEGQPFIPGPVARAHEVADRYMADKDFGVPHPDKYHPIDVEHAAAIAKAFAEMAHEPNAPAVKAAYQALAEETLAQYNAIIEHSGLKVTPVNAADYPYHGNPRAVVKDVADNNHMAFFKTDEGFGSSPVPAEAHPLLQSSGVKVGDHDMLYNDLFRVVHDYFGHVKNGYGFRGAGEDNAWRAHAAMYSPDARRAMTTETRGQNSWLNYGPHGEHNRTANATDTIYAPQKIGLLPDWVMQDRAGPTLMADSQAVGAPLAALEHAPKFYSGVERAVEGVQQPKMTGEQWLGTLTNKGAKPEELQWTGLGEFLSSKKGEPVTKAEVQEHLGANKVELNEIQKGDRPAGWSDFSKADQDIWRERYQHALDDDMLPDGVPARRRPTESDIVDFFNAVRHDYDDPPSSSQVTRHEDYQLPGGENYREKLLTLPRKGITPEELMKRDGSLNVHNKGELSPVYMSPSAHYDEPNILVSRRSNDREMSVPFTPEEQAAVAAHEQAKPKIAAVRQQQDVVVRQIRDMVKPLEKARQDQIIADIKAGKISSGDGLRALQEYVDHPEIKPLQDRLDSLRATENALLPDGPLPKPKSVKSLHIEEIQSDWHQQGRKRGYASEQSKAEYERLNGELQKAQEAMSRRASELSSQITEADLSGSSRYPINDFYAKDAKYSELKAKADELEAQRSKVHPVNMVPDAPFKKNWHELALKDAIREAAEKGHDRISWTPGEAQAARYDLSKHVDSIRATPVSEAEGAKHIDIKGKPGVLASARVDAQGKILQGYDTLKDAAGKNIAEFIGKDVAERLLGSEGVTELSGDGLKIGGDGMKGFYNKIIPDALNKIGKPHGVKVEKGQAGGQRARVLDENGKVVNSFDDKAAADRWLERTFTPENAAKYRVEEKPQPVHYMDIPQSLKDQALKKGFSLFEDSASAGAPLSALERAADQGFDTSKKWYHSALQPVEQFDKYGKFIGHSGTSGVHLTDNPEMASRYLDRYGDFDYKGVPFQKNIMPVYVRPGKTLERQEPFKSAVPMGAPIPEGYQSPVERMGYDSLVRSDAINRRGGVKHVDPSARGAIKGNEMVLTDPSRIRSVHAQFDPEHVGKPGLLLEDAASAGAPLSALEGNARARDPALWHGISDVKLPKPISEMSAVHQPTATAAEKTLRPADLKGSELMPLLGDRSAAGSNLTQVNGFKFDQPVEMQGGHGFMPANADTGAAWAANKFAASGIANRAKAASERGPVHGVYTAMGERSADFSHHVSDTLSEMLKHTKVAKANKEAFDDAMRARKGSDFPAIESWPGLDAKNLREYLQDAPGLVRNKFAKIMDTAKFQRVGFPSVAEARFAITDPRLLHEATGASGLSIARMDPAGGTTRAPGQHPSYDTSIAGKYVGGLPSSIPKEVMYPEIVNAIEHYRSGMKGFKPTIDYLMARTPKGLPLTQKVDQKWIDTVSDYLQRRGHKGMAQGGAVVSYPSILKHFAEGGEVDDTAVPTFDPTKLTAAPAADAPKFDPSKLATKKQERPEAKTIGEGLQRVWEHPTPGGPVWMAKEAWEGIKGSVDAAKARYGPPAETEEEAYFQNKREDRGAYDALRAVSFLSPGAPKGAGGVFAAPMSTSVAPTIARGIAAKAASPEAQANRELADEFGFKLSRGQATRDLDQIRYEDMAARDAFGKEVQDKASGFFNQQYEDIQSGTQQVGQTVSRGVQPTGSPTNAAASLNREVADAAARARDMRDQITQRAEQAEAARRAAVDTSGRALDDSITQGRPPVSPRDAGEIANTGVRGAADQDRAFYQAKYEDVSRRPGEFDVGAFQGVGSRVRNSLHNHETDPVEITELTPAATHAINALDHWSQPNITNAADPKGAFADAPTSITLKNVDTFMKRLSGFYKQAQSPEDQRAVRRIMSEFGDQVEQAVADGLFSGDPEALTVLREAKGAFARYQQTYKPRNSGDDVGAAMRRIVERNATPEETANLIIGSGQIGNAGLPVRIVDRLQEVLGADSPAFQSIRDAMYVKASQVRDKTGQIDPIASAKSLDTFAGSSLAQRMFPQERAAMRRHAQAIRDLDRSIENMPETAAAEQARNIYQEAFGGDQLGGAQRAVFRRMVEGTATPEETAQVMLAAIGSGNPGDAARALRAVRQIVGPDSPVMGTLREGVWQKITQEPFGKDQKGQQKMVQAIREFLNGKGRTVASELYTAEERQLMNRFADAVSLTIIPKYARTNSDTAPALLAAARKYAGAIGAAVGAIFHGGASGGAEGYAAMKAVDFVGGKIGAQRQRKKLSDSLEDVIPKPRRAPLPLPAASLRDLPVAPATAKDAIYGSGDSKNPYAP